jgi:hypothetical protein
MGRKLRTTLPITPDQLVPSWPSLEEFRAKDDTYKQQQAKSYNDYYKTKDLPELQAGAKVWITDQKRPGVIERKTEEPRSYTVQTESSTLRHNRRHMIATSYDKANLDCTLPIGSETVDEPSRQSTALTVRETHVLISQNRQDQEGLLFLQQDWIFKRNI